MILDALSIAAIIMAAIVAIVGICCAMPRCPLCRKPE